MGTVRSRPTASAMRDVLDVGFVQRHHHTVHPFLERTHGCSAEPAAQQAVGGGGRAAAHEVAEHHGAGLLAGDAGELVGDDVADATESLGVVVRAVDDLGVAAQRRGALGDDDDGVVRATLLAALDGAATDSYVNGISGMRMTWAPLATPEYSAIQPALRPITSTTNTRLCDAAVVNSRSMDSVAISTAVAKPNVTSVRSRSLSMVFGTPMTRMPSSYSRWAMDSEPSPPMLTSASMPASRNFAHQLGGAVLVHDRAVGLHHREVARVAAVGAAQHGAAEVTDAADVVRVEREHALRRPGSARGTADR